MASLNQPTMVTAVKLRMLAVFATLLAAGPADAQSGGTCTDKIFPGVGVGGPGATAETTVDTMEECCDLCHTNYHDECVAWIWGQTGEGKDSHNCAIMPRLLPKRTVQNHTTGIVPGARPAPPPAPAALGESCNADISCDLTGQYWRCKDNKTVATTSNNCHLPGPGSKGNSTCACSTQTCGTTTVPTSTAKVNFLCIGDSISLGMESDLKAILAQHEWTYTHSPGNAASSNLGYHCLDSWLVANETKWDMISYNFGLHDLGFDTERISVQQYTTLMTSITSKLVTLQKSSGTKLVWITTTPVPTVPVYDQKTCNDTSTCINPPRYDADVVLYNEAAAKIVASANNAGANIVTVDLYSYVLGKCGGPGYAHCDGFQLPANVHYTSDGWAALANVTAQHLLAAAEY